MVAALESLEAKRYLQLIREGLEGLERLFGQTDGSEPDPYARREFLLGQIYEREGVERSELMGMLREAGTAYQWIGQQVKKEYLSVMPLPSGKVRYTVTPRAVRELALNKRAVAEEADPYTAMSEEAFAEDWDSPEDAIYDKL